MLFRSTAPQAPSRPAPPAAAPAQAPVANAPLSLSPNANNNALPPPTAIESAPAPRNTNAPTRLASAPPNSPPPAPAQAAPRGGGGRYLVQVSSQRSEAEAEAAYRGLQSRYGSILGGQAHVVRRADLGNKGTYYRAMVGPFGSREEANQVCSSLKSAGGDCIVQSN